MCPEGRKTFPASPEAQLFSVMFTVEPFASIRVPLFTMPPPRDAVFSVIVPPSRVRVPVFVIPPPFPAALPPVSLPPPAVSFKIRLPSLFTT